MEIVIKCKGAIDVNIDELHELQPSHFKTLTEQNYVNLRNSILTEGFCDPLSIWIDPEGTKWFIDGHQRKRTLIKMRDEGTTIPLLPADVILAETKQEAIRKLLVKEFPYGEVQTQGTMDFLNESGIVLEDILDVLPDGIEEYIERNENPKKQKQIVLIQCPNCKHEFAKP